MITPLTAAGDVDQEGLAAHVDRLIAAGVNGLFVLGTSGEGPLLGSVHCRQVIRAAVEASAGRVPVLAGALEPSAVRAIEAALVAAECGANAVVATTPYYFEADDSGIRDHLLRVADNSPLPVVLYNIPSKTHHILTTETVADLANHPNVTGIKDSHGDWAAFERLLALRRADFTVLQGAEHLSARSMLAGGDGLVPGLSNVAPGLFAAIIRAARAGHDGEALALQAKADTLGTLHTYGHWLACLKYAASRIGPTQPTTLAQAAPLSEAARSAINALVALQQGDVA
jgi:4-hydroxy-tetrahydrodipicolinate synthase